MNHHGDANLTCFSLLIEQIHDMAVYSLKKVQRIPVTLDKAWEFFSHPGNLAEMTPKHLNLKFTNDLHGEKMYAGQVITYKVRPLFGIPMFWLTEITHVSDRQFFVDEQRFGPYRFWHHQHHFREIEGGVEMTDIVHYKIPGWFIGDLFQKIYIGAELERIFKYRVEKVEELFGKWGAYDATT